MLTAIFEEGNNAAEVYGVWQWDYGQTLRIQGLRLPKNTEVHFVADGNANAITRIGVTADGVTDAPVPDSLLELGRDIRAYVYISDTQSGMTKKEIYMYVKKRAKPEVFDTPSDEELFRKTIETVNDAAGRAETAEEEAERWAVGREDVPESLKNNAKYYAIDAGNKVNEIPGHVIAAKKEIDTYVNGKEQELKGDVGNVFFASFLVVNGRLKMYSDPKATKIAFTRSGSRLKYKVAI